MLRAALEGLVKNTEAQGGRYYGGYAIKPTPAAHKEYQEKGYVSWGNGLSGGHGKAVTSLTLYNCLPRLVHCPNGERAWAE